MESIITEFCLQHGVETMKDAMRVLICKNSMWKAWDDPTNVELTVEDIKAERALQMGYFFGTRVYDRFDRSELKHIGCTSTGTRLSMSTREMP